MASFIPSLRFHFLTPYYDFLFHLLLPGKNIRNKLLNMSAADGASEIIELGCGTGSFTVLLAQKHRNAAITAVDPDKQALSILAAKISRKGLASISLQNISAIGLPFLNKSVDLVYSSLLFCNLSYTDKLKTISEANRVLKNNGQFIIADWGQPQTLRAKAGFTLMQWVGGKANTQDMRGGMLLNYLQDEGFDAGEVNSINTFFGTVYFYRAVKAGMSSQE